MVAVPEEAVVVVAARPIVVVTAVVVVVLIQVVDLHTPPTMAVTVGPLVRESNPNSNFHGTRLVDAGLIYKKKNSFPEDGRTDLEMICRRKMIRDQLDRSF